MFQGSLQQQQQRSDVLGGNANNNDDDEIFTSLLERKDELIFEVDRVNKLTKHDCYNGNNDNNELFNSEMLDQAMVGEEGNDERDMDDLLFVVGEFHKTM